MSIIIILNFLIKIKTSLQVLSVIQTVDVVIITKCSLVSAKIDKSSFGTYLLNMLGCLQFIVDPKNITLLQFSIQTKV
jgi:hypothetical protein